MRICTCSACRATNPLGKLLRTRDVSIHLARDKKRQEVIEGDDCDVSDTHALCTCIRCQDNGRVQGSWITRTLRDSHRLSASNAAVSIDEALGSLINAAVHHPEVQAQADAEAPSLDAAALRAPDLRMHLESNEIAILASSFESASSSSSSSSLSSLSSSAIPDERTLVDVDVEVVL